MNATRFRMPRLNEEQVMHAMSIDDAYRIERVLAEGCAGVTECVTIDNVGPFVRKRIPSKLANRGVWAALAECSSPRLPQMAATYEMPDQFIAVYDYVPGDTLSNIVASCGRLEASDAVQMLREIAEAVSDLHAHGIVHCDLAPSNIVLAADGAHLIDFGIAQLMGRGMTADSVPLGTWGFAAPEQYGFAPVDVRTDVFSLARVLGYALCGTMPDDEAFSVRLADATVVPPALRSVVERGAAFEPSVRYQSGVALAEAAESALQGEMPAVQSNATGGVAAATSVSKDSSAGSSRNIMRIVLAVVVAMSCLALIAFLVVPRVQGFVGGESQKSMATSNGLSESADEDGAARTDNVWNGGEEKGAASADGSSTPEAHEALSLIETGWTADPSGYINYGFGLQNSNENAAVLFPTVTITGRDSNGVVLFSDDQVLNFVYPGQTVYFGFTAGGGTAPASVDFKIKKPTELDLKSNVGKPLALSVSNASAVDDGMLGMKFTGEVELMGGEHLDPSMGGAALTVILRNAEGSIVFGNTTFVDSLQEGESTPFEIRCFSVPDHATYEIHAQPW